MDLWIGIGRVTELVFGLRLYIYSKFSNEVISLNNEFEQNTIFEKKTLVVPFRIFCFTLQVNVRRSEILREKLTVPIVIGLKSLTWRFHSITAKIFCGFRPLPYVKVFDVMVQWAISYTMQTSTRTVIRTSRKNIYAGKSFN